MTGVVLLALCAACVVAAVVWWKASGKMNRGIVFLTACSFACFAALGGLAIAGVIDDGVVELGRRSRIPLSRSEGPVGFWLFIALVTAFDAVLWACTAYFFHTAFMRRRRPERHW